MTPQAKMQAKLEQAGIPFKRVHVYGSQIMVTAWSEKAARKWADLLRNFAKVRGVTRSIENNQINENTVLNPTAHTVWLVWATI